MALSSKLAGKAMGAMERTKKFLGLPGYDEATAAAQKEMDDEIARLKKLEKSKELTPREEKKLDTLMNRKIREEGAETEAGMARTRKTKPLTEKEKKEMREEGAETEAGMARTRKTKPLTEKEKKEMQESLELRKGGYAKKTTMKMAKGGMSTGYNKGGMANCGASMKPNGGSRNK